MTIKMAKKKIENHDSEGRIYSHDKISKLIWSHRKNQFGVSRAYVSQLLDAGLLQNIECIRVDGRSSGRVVGIKITCTEERFSESTKDICWSKTSPRVYS